MKKGVLIFLLIGLMTFSAGCSLKNNEILSKTGFYFDTVIKITLYDSSEEVLDNCFSLCEKYEKIFSPTLEDSELYRLNTASHEVQPGDSLEISQELFECFEKALRYYDITGGSYDVSVMQLTKLWNIPTKAVEGGTAPLKEEIEEALDYCGSEYISLYCVPEKNKFYINYKKSGIEIDFGSAAKGYIAGKIREYLLSEGVESALVNLGGNICCIGSKPVNKLFGKEYQPFEIGIKTETEDLPVLKISDNSVVTSGIYERYFTDGDRVYSHILDAKTGYPVENELYSVTIITDDAFDADILSTVCFILGKEKAQEYIDASEDVSAVLVLKSGETVYIGEEFE